MHSTWGSKVLEAEARAASYERLGKYNGKPWREFPFWNYLHEMWVGGLATLAQEDLESLIANNVIWRDGHAGKCLDYSLPILIKRITYEPSWNGSSVAMFQDDFGIFLLLVPNEAKVRTWPIYE